MLVSCRDLNPASLAASDRSCVQEVQLPFSTRSDMRCRSSTSLHYRQGERIRFHRDSVRR